MRMRLALSGVVVVFLMAGSAHAGLVIMDAESGVGPTDLVSTILGSGVTVTNVTYNGCPLGDGTFTGGADIVGFDSGVILSSGNAGSAVGPNDNSGKSTTCQGAGDPDLDALVPGTQTLDAAVLE